MKADQRHVLQRLSAPIDGTVQQLAVHTVGGVVTPAQLLMIVVPSGVMLEIEAMVLNRDIGFVRAGQTAEIKLETFPFTRYGTIRGEVTDVASGAIQDEKLGLVYSTRVAMARTVMPVEGKGQPRAGHGRDGRDQDRAAAADRVSSVAAAPLQAGKPARALTRTLESRRVTLRRAIERYADEPRRARKRKNSRPSTSRRRQSSH